MNDGAPRVPQLLATAGGGMLQALSRQSVVLHLSLMSVQLNQ
jgi:hypothetical protein